jgi:hypothetical protein
MEHDRPNDRSPAPEAPPDPERAALAVWGPVLLLAALGVFLAGGGPANFRSPPPAGLPEGAELPVAIEPSGLIDAPPRRFVWRPGGTPDLSQLVIYDEGFLVIWASRPLPPGTSEWEVPPEVFEGALPGRKHYWRVRQVAGGKPHASSDAVEFIFRVDTRGFGPGEGSPPDQFLR